MSRVERTLGVQTLVSPKTCKLRGDELVPVHGSHPNPQVASWGWTERTGLCTESQRSPTFFGYISRFKLWHPSSSQTNMHHAVFNHFFSKPHRLKNISKTKIWSQLDPVGCPYEHHPFCTSVWNWHPMDPIDHANWNGQEHLVDRSLGLRFWPLDHQVIAARWFEEQFYVIWHVEWDAVKGEGFSNFSASAARGSDGIPPVKLDDDCGYPHFRKHPYTVASTTQPFYRTSGKMRMGKMMLQRFWWRYPIFWAKAEMSVAGRIIPIYYHTFHISS